MDVKQTAESLASRMSAQLRVKGDGLAEVTAKAGRKLPRHLRDAAEALVQAEVMGPITSFRFRIHQQAYH